MVRICSIISRKVCTAFKKARKMSILAGMGISAGNAVAGSVGNAVGNAVTDAFGINNDKKQLDQQQKLTDMQVNANKNLANYSYGLNQKMYDYTYDKTKALTQVQNLKEAGLNPALMYGMSGSGGTSATTGSASAGSASAGTSSDSSSRQMAQTAQIGMGLQMAKLESEIDLNRSVAESNRASAGKATADTKTSDAIRDYSVEFERQQGIKEWMNNNRTKFEDYNREGKQSASYNNTKLDEYHEIETGSIFDQRITNEMLKTVAETGSIEAQKILTNQKAENYFQEILNATAMADAATKNANTNEADLANKRIQALASKLSAEYGAGEVMNTKQVIELATSILRSIPK